MDQQHYQLANSLIKDVEQGNRARFHQKAQQLISEQALLGKLWGSVAKLAMTLGDNIIAIEAITRYYQSTNTTDSLIQTLGVYGELGRFDLAEPLISGVNTDASNPNLTYFCGVMYSQLGDFVKARDYLERTLSLSPQAASAWLSLAAITSAEQAPDVKTKLEQSYQNKLPTNPIEKIQYLYALCRLNELCGDIKAAFLSAQQAAEVGKSQIRNQSYEIGEEFQLTESIKGLFDFEFVQKYRLQATEDEPTPIFVLGLPRSGTTLLSQLILKHANKDHAVVGGDELRYCQKSLLPLGLRQMCNAKEDSQNPDVIKRIIKHFRAEYMYRLQADYGNATVVVDKSLDLYRYSGLLACAFPNAIFVHINREQRDVAWSCYKHFFNKGIPWCYDLAEMKHFFEDFFGQIDHWRTILSERFIDIEYESLVSKPQGILEQVLSSANLAFEGDINNGPVNKTKVATNSLYYVRQPLSTSFINKSMPLAEEFSLFNA